MSCLGLDVGGANLKVAHSAGWSRGVPFELWRRPSELAATLANLIAQAPTADRIALTMTGELADCYPTKQIGVQHILDAVCTAAGSRPVWTWTTSGEFVAPEHVGHVPLKVAASNWHAQATWGGRLAPVGPAILLDMGSTTTDLIPLHNGRPIARGTTDVTRLLAGELVYAGSRRTPLCAISQQVPYRGEFCPVSAELFATTLDVGLWLGDVAGDPSATDTANGRPATRDHAWDRLARQLCCDREEFTAADADVAAVYWRESLFQKWTEALLQVVSTLGTTPQALIISGSGSSWLRAFLQQHPLGTVPRIELAEHLNESLAECACAYAVAVLLEERGL